MNDLQLLALITETDAYADTTPLPATVAGVEDAFVDLVARFDDSTTAPAPGLVEEARVTIARWRFRRGALVAVAAFVTVIAVGVALFALSRPSEQDFVDTPTTTTAAPTTTVAPTATPEDDIALFEAAVAAWYDNDFEAVTELLQIPSENGSQSDWTPEQVREAMEYESVVGGRIEDPSCSPPTESGKFFQCRLLYLNTLSDAFGITREPDGNGTFSIRVEDGKVVAYEFHNGLDYRHAMLDAVGAYLAFEDRVDEYWSCTDVGVNLGQTQPSCGETQLANLEGLVEWTATVTPFEIAAAYAEAWFGGDCLNAALLEDSPLFPDGCPRPEIDYEAILGATVDVTDCAFLPGEPEDWNINCQVAYSNALNEAVGADPAVLTVPFWVDPNGLPDADGLPATTARFDTNPQVYPMDRALLTSFEDFGDATGLTDALRAACSISLPKRTPECASFMVTHLDDWATWHVANR